MSNRRMHTRLTGAELTTFLAKATELYQAGQSLRAVAAAMGCSYTTLHSRLTTAGVPLRNRRRGADPIPADQYPDLRRRYEDGATISQLAKALGHTNSKIAHALHKAGTHMRPAGGRSPRIGGM